MLRRALSLSARVYSTCLPAEHAERRGGGAGGEGARCHEAQPAPRGPRPLLRPLASLPPPRSPLLPSLRLSLPPSLPTYFSSFLPFHCSCFGLLTASNCLGFLSSHAGFLLPSFEAWPATWPPCRAAVVKAAGRDSQRVGTPGTYMHWRRWVPPGSWYLHCRDLFVVCIPQCPHVHFFQYEAHAIGSFQFFYS